MLGTFKIRAWRRAIVGRGIGTQTLGFDVVIAGDLVGRFLPSFASTFAAVTAVAVTRAAFAAFTVLCGAGAFGCCVGVCSLVCAQGRFGRVGIGGITCAALRAFATLTAAFAPALATFAAAFTGLAWSALWPHFNALGIQFGLGIVAAFTQAVAALAFGQVFAACA